MRWVNGLLLVSQLLGAAACSGSAPASLPAQASQPASAVSLAPTSAAPVVHPETYSEVAGRRVASVVHVPAAGAGQGPITLLTVDQTRLRLTLHSGSQEPVRGGVWVHGPEIGKDERHRIVAAFNGGFKIRDARGGWFSEGRTVVPLVRGAASVVMYADGFTDVGAWGVEVPDRHRQVVSVRQNLTLLVDSGAALRTLPRSQRQLDLWWGHAFREQPLISRSALAITRTGSLLWAAGTRITVAELARALVAHGAVRALELDVNAPLVRGFLFPGAARVVAAGSLASTPLPLVVGQTQPASLTPRATPHCDYVRPCPRDFFTVLLRSPSP